MSAATEQLIAAIGKNAREQVRVTLGSFNGHRLCHVRTYLLVADGVECDPPRPTKKGVAVKAAALPELIEALERACVQEGIDPRPARLEAA